MLVTLQFCKNSKKPLGHPTGQTSPKSNFFCQQNLTKPSNSLLNRDTYPNFTQMGINKGAALGTMMMGALVAPEALAGDKTGEIKLAAATTGVSQQVDCVAYAREGTSALLRFNLTYVIITDSVYRLSFYDWEGIMVIHSGGAKRYIVRLSSEERNRLETIIRTGRDAAGRLLKARILLK